MIVLHVGDVVHKVVDGRRARERRGQRRGKDESKRKLVSSLVTLPRECSASQTIGKAVDRAAGNGPGVTGRKALRVIPDRRCSETRQYWRQADIVVLLVTTNEQGLTVSQVELELAHLTLRVGGVNL